VCTLSILLGLSSRYPLMVAANRDESRTRESRPPLLWSGPPAFVAGRDERAGGTWLGVNEHGLFVGLTNLWTGRPPDPARASRGQLVVDALAHPSVEATAAWMAAQEPEATNPFLLVCAAASGDAFWTMSEDGLAVHPLGPGVHSFSNLPPGSALDPKPPRMTSRFEPATSERRDASAEDLLVFLREALATHVAGGSPRESICVHTPGDYGTVSSTVVLLGRSLRESRLFYAPGPPCVTPFEDLSAWMVELDRRFRARTR
jgi:hypothetical protein